MGIRGFVEGALPDGIGVCGAGVCGVQSDVMMPKYNRLSALVSVKKKKANMIFPFILQKNVTLACIFCISMDRITNKVIAHFSDKNLFKPVWDYLESRKQAR